MVFQYLTLKCISLPLTPCFWRNECPVQGHTDIFIFSLFFFFKALQPWHLSPFLDSPSLGSKVTRLIWGVSLGLSAQDGDSLNPGLCGFPGMKSGQKILCNITAKPTAGPGAPHYLHLCIPVLSGDVISRQGRPSPLNIRSRGSRSPHHLREGALWLQTIHMPQPRPHESLGPHLK